MYTSTMPESKIGSAYDNSIQFHASAAFMSMKESSIPTRPRTDQASLLNYRSSDHWTFYTPPPPNKKKLYTAQMYKWLHCMMQYNFFNWQKKFLQF